MTTIEEVRAARAAQEEAEKAEAEAREILDYELEQKFSSLGKRGVDFEVLVTDVGGFVVAKPEYIVMKVFRAAATTTEEDVAKLVMPSLKFPEQMAAREVLKDHSGIMWRLATLLGAMSAGEGRARRGK